MLIAVACAPKKPGKSGTQQRALSGRESEAVLEVGSDEINVDEYQQRVSSLRSVLPGAEAGTEQIGAVIDFELLADEAERRGYGKDARVVDAVKDALASAADRRQKSGQVAALARPPHRVDVDEAAVKRAFEAGKKKQ